VKRIARASSLLLTLLLATGLSQVAARHPSVAEGELKFRLADLGGAMVSSSDSRFKGRVVLVKGIPVEILVDRTGHVVQARNSYGYNRPRRGPGS